ncbi:MAG TPA: PaaI family thioesterase [Gaiellaceae bacterium]|nr:PaaI family thioesterase [Gaiellaceae bacterium]
MEITLAQLQEMGSAGFPGLLGIEFEEPGDGVLRARLTIEEKHMAPNGYLHAGTVVGFADSACGYGCILNLPDGGIGFTTVELKTNFLRSAQTGTIACEARLVHAGKTTQLWDATVTDPDGKTMALFRCTQLILRPRV